MKKFLLIGLIFIVKLSSNAQSQRELEDKIRSEINAEFDTNAAKCSDQVDAVTDFNGKTEFWRICELESNSRILQIESYNDTVYSQEVYFEKNGELIYAKETENYLPKNHFIQVTWNCEFYTQNGKLISLMSLGHGKTEDEEWDPEIIFEMHKKRLTELEKIKN